MCQDVVPRTQTQDRFTEKVCFFCQKQSARKGAFLSVSLCACVPSPLSSPPRVSEGRLHAGAQEVLCTDFLLSGSRVLHSGLSAPALTGDFQQHSAALGGCPHPASRTLSTVDGGSPASPQQRPYPSRWDLACCTLCPTSTQ